METKNSQINQNADKRELCPKCNLFYGTSATNFMCSKWFKEHQDELKKSGVTVEPDHKAGTASGDAVMTIENQQEEEKAPAKPIQVSLSLFHIFNI